MSLCREMGDLDINEKRKKKCVSLFILKLMRKEKNNVYLCSYSSMIPSCFLPWNSHPEEYHWAAGSFQYLPSSSAITSPLRLSYFPHSCSCWSLLLERGSTPPKSYFLLWGMNSYSAHVSVPMSSQSLLWALASWASSPPCLRMSV